MNVETYVKVEVKLGECPDCSGQAWAVSVDGKKPVFRHRQKTDAEKFAETHCRDLLKEKKQSELTVFDPKGRVRSNRYFEVDDDQMELGDTEEEG